jgi:hypothetical protein
VYDDVLETLVAAVFLDSKRLEVVQLKVFLVRYQAFECDLVCREGAIHIKKI